MAGGCAFQNLYLLESMKLKNGHGRGGARPGAGRKPMPPALRKEPINVKLPLWLIKWLDARPESRAVLIEDALKQRYKLKSPYVKQGEAAGAKGTSKP